MPNLTISVDAELLKRARIRALGNGSSVNALLREYLEAYADPGRDQERAIRGLQDLADRCRSGSGGRRWSRDELYER